MKNNIILAFAAAAVAFASCNKQAEVEAPALSGAKATLNVSVNGGMQTKASAETLGDEAKVNNLQVFVFNGDQLDVYGSKDGATSLSLTATTGDRTVYALVNAPDLSSVVTMSGLKAAVTKLSDNTASGFVMVGSATVTLAQNSNVSVAVDRIAARIRIKKITRKMSAAGLAALDASKFEVTKLYVAEVATDNDYAVSKTSGFTWENSSLNGSALSTANTFLYNKPATAVTIAQDASWEQDLQFYVYPNPTTAESATALFTRLVVECCIDGNHYTYPVLISGVEANKSYEINELVLTRLGNPSDGDDDIDDGEDDAIESFEIPFGITVNDWTLSLLGDNGTVTI